MTSPRVIVAGATTAITRRTTLRKAFLGPWDPLVQQCWLYALADAQRHTGVAIHHGVLVVNHEHLTVTPREDNLPEFVRQACSEGGRVVRRPAKSSGAGVSVNAGVHSTSRPC